MRSRTQRGTVWSGVVWGGTYSLLVLLPVLVLSASLGGPRGSGWWFDFAMGAGFGALAIMGGQFALTARLRRATAPFGIDVIYVFHRWLAVVGLALILMHWGVLRIRYPSTLVPVLPPDAPGYMTAGRVALLCFVLLIASSLWRKRLGIEYEAWRITHAVLALAGIALAAAHVRGVGYYTGLFWNRVVLDLFLGSVVALAVYVRVVKPILMQSISYEVTEVRPEPGDAWTLRVEPRQHEGLRFLPGQFGWLSLGVQPWRAKEHPFSFSSSAEDEAGLEFTIKELGDFTRDLGRVEVGTVAYIDGPHGSFSVDRTPNATGFFFLAGGVGIAPIMSMLRTLADRGDERPIWLVYGASSLDTMVFREELDEVARRLDVRTTLIPQVPPAEWAGDAGLPSPELLARVLGPAPEGIHAFLCGPKPMSDMAQQALHDLGVPLRRIHFELFDLA